MDSNACRAREVERKVWRDNDSLLRSLLLKTPQLVYRPVPLSQSSESAGQWRRVATGIGATELRSGPDTLLPLRIVALRSRLVGLV